MTSINHGTNVSSGTNLRFSPTGATTGFRFGNDADFDLNGSTLSNYQEWQFTFSAPVTDVVWTVFDVDSHGSGNRWVDAVGAESWIGSPGTLGTGTAVNWDTTGSELIVDSSSYAVDFVARDVATFGHDNVATTDAEGTSTLTVSALSDGLSLYFFNEGMDGGNHNIVNAGTFSFTSSFAPVPEPSALVLVLLGGCSSLTIRRRKRRRHTT